MQDLPSWMQSSIMSGKSSQTGKTSAPRIAIAWLHSLAQRSSLMSRQSCLKIVCRVLLESHKLKMKRQIKGIKASLHCWLGLRKERPVTRSMALVSPSCWSTPEGIPNGDGTPEKHTCSDVRSFLQTSPE